MMSPALCPGPRPQTRTPATVLPEHACDCHFHVFDGPSTQVEMRSYTAPRVPLAAYLRMRGQLGLTRSVIVQPSVYGTDNRTTLDTLARSGGQMRAIVVPGREASDADLAQMRARGAVGARLNLLFDAGAALQDMHALARRIAAQDWHLQILTDLAQLCDLDREIGALPVPVVFDHMGHVAAGNGLNSAGFQALLRLLDRGTVWVKLSGAYRLTQAAGPPYADVAPLARALIAANPERLVWGTDWPHPQIQTAMPDDADLLDLLAEWCPSEAVLHRILVDNPQELYHFDAPEPCHDR